MGSNDSKFDELSHGESTEQWLDKIEVKTAQGFAGQPLPRRHAPRQMQDVVRPSDPSYKVDDDDLPVITPPNDNLGQAFKAFRKELVARVKYLAKVAKTVTRYFRDEFKRLHVKHPKFASMMAILVIAPAILIGGGIIASQQRKSPEQTAVGTTIPTTFVESANTELYYPTNLPEGYVIRTEDDAAVIDKTLVTYSLSDGSNVITVNHQYDIPPEAIKQLVGKTSPTETSLGDAYIITDDSGSALRAILVSDSVTILFNSQNPVEKDVMQQIVQSMKKR